MDPLIRIYQINELLQNMRLPFPLDTIERVSHIAYRNFGIDVNGHEARVREKSANSFLREWYESDWRMHAIIADGINKTQFRDAMAAMNREIARIVFSILRIFKLKNGSIRVLDIGTGTGDTIRETIWNLRNSGLNEVLRNLHFTLNDIAVHELNNTATWVTTSFGIPVQIAEGSAESVLPDFENYFDLITSNGVFHHFSFPHVHALTYNALKPGGVMLIGDYHTRMYETPALLAYYLEELGANKGALNSFRKYFGLNRLQHEEELGNLSPAEGIAIEHTIQYAQGLLALIRERRVRDVVIKPIEAHRSSVQMAAEMSDAGFAVGLGEVRRVFSGFRVERQKSLWSSCGRLVDSDVAKVTVGVKIPGHLQSARKTKSRKTTGKKSRVNKQGRKKQPRLGKQQRLGRVRTR